MILTGKIVFNRVSRGSKSDRIAAFLQTKNEMLPIRLKDGNPFMQDKELAAYQDKDVIIQDAEIRNINNKATVLIQSKKHIGIRP
ncbi:MAG: hypothetical protein EP349_05070 [Alphaproteobacteria bacterium]|nr:MAG: hypothetical protein EP349_05070 [Alphaproteobacteria bacterium]